MRIWRIICGLATVGAIAAAQRFPESRIERNLKYEGPEGNVEVIGVCRLSETDVTCWNGEGKSSKALAAEVKRSFEDRNGPNIPAKMGKKTRLIVAKFDLPPYGTTSDVRLEDRFEDYSAIDIDRRPSYDTNLRRIFMRGKFVTVEKEEKTTSVGLRLQRNFAPSEPFALVEGASVRYMDTTIKIVKIVKSEVDGTQSGAPGGSRWIIHHSYDPVREWFLEWGAVDQEGIPIHAVDANGKPKYLDPAVMQTLRSRVYGGQINRGSEPPPGVFASGFWVGNYGLETFANRPVLMTNVNPADIKHVSIKASSKQLIVLKDIPLDPK